MSQMIKANDGSLLRINPKDPSHLEKSITKGTEWFRFGETLGSKLKFVDLINEGSRLIAMVDNGDTYASTSNGSTWYRL